MACRIGKHLGLLYFKGALISGRTARIKRSKVPKSSSQQWVWEVSRVLKRRNTNDYGIASRVLAERNARENSLATPPFPHACVRGGTMGRANETGKMAEWLEYARLFPKTWVQFPALTRGTSQWPVMLMCLNSNRRPPPHGHTVSKKQSKMGKGKQMTANLEKRWGERTGVASMETSVEGSQRRKRAATVLT